MNTVHNTRTARGARAIAARLESVPEVRLYVRSARTENIVFRIHHYLMHYCGKYYLQSSDKWNYIIVRKG